MNLARLQPGLQQIFIVAVTTGTECHRRWPPEITGTCIDKYRNKAVLLRQRMHMSRHSHHGFLQGVQNNHCILHGVQNNQCIL